MSSMVGAANNGVGLVNEIRWLGMELKPIGPDVVAKKPMLQGKQGSLVKDVKIATVAQSSGVMKGDVVLKINSLSVATPGQLDMAVAQANMRSGILLLVERNGMKRYVTLQ
jgi:S1-C subfamily serine protease